jgi:hypothetical protein
MSDINVLQKRMLFSILFILFFITSSCGSLLPSVKITTKTYQWETFDEAKMAFEKITPLKTTTEELQQLGFDPYSTPNLKILTYLDIIQLFMFNPSIKKEDLDEGIQACINAQTNCSAYKIHLTNILSKRYGSVFLDLFNFKRNIKDSGWEFEALIVIVNNTVVYKLWGGKPQIDENKVIKNPLGPLQNPSDLLIDTTRRFL